jgi:hypothetical protein
MQIQHNILHKIHLIQVLVLIMIFKKKIKLKGFIFRDKRNMIIMKNLVLPIFIKKIVYLMKS